MIPRKKIQLLLRILCIYYAFEYGECASAGATKNQTVDHSTSLSRSHTTENYSLRSSGSVTEETSTIDYTSSFTAESDETTTEGASITDEMISSTAKIDETTTTELSTCQDPPSSVANLTVSGTNTSLIVEWDPVTSNEDCVLLYNITWLSDNNYLSHVTVNFTESTFTITDLTPCTNYTINVVAVGMNGESDPETVSGTTTESQISQVGNLAVSGIEFGLNVNWDPPADVYCLKNYLIYVWMEDNETQLAGSDLTSDTFHTFQNLSACTSYIVEVIPVSINENNGTVATSNSTKTLSSVPGPVGDLTAPADQITGYSIYFTWSAPSLNINCRKSYNVSACYEDDCTSSEIDNEFYNATDLSPCRDYTFTVNAVGEAGSSDAADTTATTSYIKPDPPTEIVVTPSQYSLNIVWESTGTCTSSYYITLSNTSQSITTTDTNVTFSDLSACKNYTAHISAISISNDSTTSTTASGTVEPSVLDPPVLYIMEPEVTKSTISISWLIERTVNECELENVLTICNFTSTAGHGFETLDGQSEDDISKYDSYTNFTVDIIVSNLSPFSSYNCTGVVENSAGSSTSSDIVSVTTSEDVPSAPTLEIYSTGSSTFTLIWEEPQYLAGELIEHEISFFWRPQFVVPSWCDYNTTEKILGIESQARNYTYSGATPYSNYTATIRARTNADWGNYSIYVNFQTKPDVPGVVSNVRYLNTSSHNPNVLDTLLYWQLPCSSNGEIESFHISYYGTRDNFTAHKHSQIYGDVKYNTTAEQEFYLNFGELRAEYNYTFQVYAKVAGVSDGGLPVNYSVIYPAGIPPPPDQSYMDEISLDPYNANRTTSAAWVLLPLFNDTNGEIIYYAIMISEIEQNNSTESRFDILSGDWPETTTWKEAMSRDTIVTYQATPIQWYPNESTDIADYGHLKAVKFYLGADDSCSELSAKTHCNGPLRSDTRYEVVMRAFTNGGYRDSTFIFAATKADFNLGMVIGVVFGILFLGIIATMMLLIRKGVLQTVLSNILHPSGQGSLGPEPLTAKKFDLHCQELIENPGKLSNEFQLLQTLSVDLEMSATAAGLQANRRKNRYINILPYDISRVKLEILNNDPNSDYINASLLPGYSGAIEYIACQGPKEETTYDFWRMVLQYDVKIIVMVTQLVEKGKDKCHQYYPNTRENFEYEDIIIRCSTHLDFVFYTQRIITLQKDNVRKTITHLHFKEWSDHGVPDDIHSMINFCQIVRKLINDTRGLAIVHCSAGVGRTGTLIAIDILLQQIRDHKKLDIFGTVYRLRQHRMNMVQTESQYAYIYNCTKQALSNPYPPKHYVTSPGEPIYENLTKKKREITDSNTNLVNSAETLKRISPSLSTISMEPISEIAVRQRPVYVTQLSTLSNGLRSSKSTSAIDTQHLPDYHIDRFGSHEYPIFEPAPDSPSSRYSIDRPRSLEFARPIKFVTKISRATSINRDDDIDQCGIKSNY